MPSRTVTLQGAPGHGKSKMACETAVNKPVHVIDIDRKIASSAWAVPLIESKQLTYWEVSESFNEGQNVRARLDLLVKKEKPAQAPKGLVTIANMIYDLPSKPESKAAGTWVFDSTTLMNEYVKAHIAYLAGRTKFTFDQWAALQSWWIDTISVLRDMAKEHNKDVIFTVHERIKEDPGDRTTGVRMESVAQADGTVTQQKVFQGTMDIEVWASISGAFGGLMGAQMDEFYYLHVEIVNGKPVWKCRIHPDGRRQLRTSFSHTEAEHDPDFRKIWK